LTSSEQTNNSERITIDSDLVQHSEYGIEVLTNNDDALIKDARKLVINPTVIPNIIEIKKNKDTLLTIPVSDIEKVILASNIEQSSKKGTDSVIEISFHDDLQNKKSIILDSKNKKHANIIQQQIQLLKDSENKPSIQKAIKSALNPKLCSVCTEKELIFEFHCCGKFCLDCFEKTYGKIVMQKDKDIAYHGGHKDHVIGGFLSKNSQSGNLYLTENYFIFAKDEKEISKQWEIIIPLSSLILNRNIEEKERQKNVQWEGTTFDNFGFGSGFLRESKKSDRLVVPYIDANGTLQEPEFGDIAGVQKLAAELYRVTIKAKENLSEQQNISEKDILQTIASCFNCGRQFKTYDLIICDHCITSFCENCVKNHYTEPEIIFDSKYLGGHKLYPKPLDTKVYVFSDRIEVKGLHIRIPCSSITDIENADEKKITAKRMFLVGLYSFAWKKQHLYTIIDYTDGFKQKQSLIFDFGKKIEEAQQKIYDRMLASLFAKEKLLQLQKMDYSVKELQMPNESKELIATDSNDKLKLQSDKSLQSISDNSVVSHLTKIDKPSKDDDKSSPLHILKIRLAKGEISKEEYEEMRKMMEL
jgi:hypothetical protein